MSSSFQPFKKLLNELPTHQREELMENFQEVTIKKSDHLLKIGQVCKYMYLIKSGAIRHYRISKSGNDMSSWFSFEGDVVCVMQSFVNQEHSAAGLVAMENTTLLAIHMHKLKKMRSKYHEFETFTRRLTEEYMIFNEKRAQSMQENDAIDRYLNLIEINPQVELRVPQIHIASFIGIKKETLSRIKKKLK